MSHPDKNFDYDMRQGAIPPSQELRELQAKVDRYREALDVVREFFVYADKAGEEWSPTVQDEKFEAMRDALAAVGGDPE